MAGAGDAGKPGARVLAALAAVDAGGGAAERRVLDLPGGRQELELPALFWEALEDIAAREGMTVGALVAMVAGRTGPGGLTGALEALPLMDAMARGNDDGPG